MNRLHYLEEVAQYTGSAYPTLLKKEAGYWIDQVLSELSPSIGEIQCIFYINNRNRRTTYCSYAVKYCHVYFNNALPPEYNIFNILKKVFHLSEGDINTMLRPKLKKYFHKLGIPADKKIKFFFNKNL